MTPDAGMERIAQGMADASVSEYARSLAHAVDVKADYFPGHSGAVAYFARVMGTNADFHPAEIDALEMAGLMHDIGKLMVPISVLRKPGRLTAEEYDEVKPHAQWGAELVKYAGLGELSHIILCHHENFDGTGYPQGLRGADIPFFSRILLVADAFQVMTSKRHYAPVRTREYAVTEIQRRTGTQFCPDAVQLLAQRGVAR